MYNFVIKDICFALNSSNKYLVSYKVQESSRNVLTNEDLFICLFICLLYIIIHDFIDINGNIIILMSILHNVNNYCILLWPIKL